MTARDPRWLPIALAILLGAPPLAVTTSAAAKPAVKAKTPSKGGSYFRLDKVKSTFSQSCGFRVAGSEKGTTETKVILSSVPVDCATADQEFDPVSFLENAIGEKKGAYATLDVSADGTRIDGNWRSTEPSDAFSFGGQGEIQLTKNDATRVEGRYRTTKPESFFDKSFEFDLTFAVDLLAGSLSGTPLPKGGGEPGKVYQAYLKAVAKEDPKSMQELVTQARAEEIGQQVESGYFKELFKISKSLELKSCTITGGLQKGDRVALAVEGKSFDGDKMRGQVFLVKEGDTWKVGEKRVRLTFD